MYNALEGFFMDRNTYPWWDEGHGYHKTESKNHYKIKILNEDLKK